MFAKNMALAVTFYGTSAAVPSLNRGFSCIGLSNDKNPEGGLVLLDCGDGAIRNLLKFGAKIENISTVVITHYHSDHITGLTQIIESMAIKKKKTNLRIFGPLGLKEYFSTIEKITNVASHRQFQIGLLELSPNDNFKFENYSATAFLMDHTIPCLGYRISVSDSKIISYTGDTMPCASLKELGKDSDVLIHEATFLQKDQEKAREQKHSTSLEAAKAAKSAKTKKLILTHVNDDSETEDKMIAEARPEFEDVVVANDGLGIKI